MKTVKLLVMIVLLAGITQAQSAKKKQPSVVETPHLTSYMRDAGLLYIETVEKAVDIWTDPSMTPNNIIDKVCAERSEEQFRLLKALEDRIEMHKNWASILDDLGAPDKQFYDFGLQELKLLARARVDTYESVYSRLRSGIALRQAGMPAEADAMVERSKACQQAVLDEIEPYVSCDVQVRSTIKDGEWHQDKTRQLCDLASMTKAQGKCH
jgi:hypothetical protein